MAEQEGPIDIGYEMPKAKEIQYADLGPSRKYDPDAPVESGGKGEELDQEKLDMALAIERSKRNVPPHLRRATGESACETCRHFHNDQCELYDGYPVNPGEVCDSWSEFDL